MMIWLVILSIQKGANIFHPTSLIEYFLEVFHHWLRLDPGKHLKVKHLEGIVSDQA